MPTKARFAESALFFAFFENFFNDPFAFLSSFSIFAEFAVRSIAKLAIVANAKGLFYLRINFLLLRGWFFFT